MLEFTKAAVYLALLACAAVLGPMSPMYLGLALGGWSWDLAWRLFAGLAWKLLSPTVPVLLLGSLALGALTIRWKRERNLRSAALAGAGLGLAIGVGCSLAIAMFTEFFYLPGVIFGSSVAVYGVTAYALVHAGGLTRTVFPKVGRLLF